MCGKVCLLVVNRRRNLDKCIDSSELYSCKDNLETETNIRNFDLETKNRQAEERNSKIISIL